MNPKIEHRENFTVLGVQSSVKRGSETPELFAGIWERFETGREHVESLSLRKQYYGINFPTGAEEVSEYLAGMMVADDATAPDEWVKRKVPEGHYAIFECPVAGIGLCYQTIFTKWLPAASVSIHPGNPVFEEYPEKGSTLPVRIHVPVIKNE